MVKQGRLYLLTRKIASPPLKPKVELCLPPFYRNRTYCINILLFPSSHFSSPLCKYTHLISAKTPKNTHSYTFSLSLHVCDNYRRFVNLSDSNVITVFRSPDFYFSVIEFFFCSEYLIGNFCGAFRRLIILLKLNLRLLHSCFGTESFKHRFQIRAVLV
ncbi:hypothetical protein P3S68_021668 [Capsicum galapagoense]